MKLIFSTFLGLGFGLTLISPVLAQITTDGSTNTTLTPTDNGVQIDDGLRTGDNLFHSFGEFSVPNGSEAFFNNATDVANIFSRVTGGNISNIDGLIRANGAANLFLINPQGILFGNNARLDIGGSFYGSTADSILFPEGEFSAVDLDNPPLLTINAPIGLRFRDNPGEIVNQSVAGGVGLTVAPGENLALIGGNITLEGGRITAPGGRVELGSINSESVVSLEPTSQGFVLGYEEVPNLGNIQLNQQAMLDTSGSFGGTIQIQGEQLSVQDGSQIFSTTTSGDGGDIVIDTSQLAISNEGAIFTATLGSGDGGDIVIDTDKLAISNEAEISTITTFGSGMGGDINISATEAIEIIGNGFDEFQETFVRGVLLGTTITELLQQGTRISVSSLGIGQAGSLTIDTSSFRMSDGGVIISPTLTSGRGGDIKITATEGIEIIGSGVQSGSARDSIGRAGDILVEAKNLEIRDGAIIANITLGSGKGGDIVVNVSENIELSNTPVQAFIPAGILANSSIGTGQAGNIAINASNLFMSEGAIISNNSGSLISNPTPTDDFLRFNGGNAGNIDVNVSGLIHLTGISPNEVTTSGFGSAAFSDNSSAGDINISTGNLLIENGAGIDASTIGSGEGGTITIKARESVIVTGKSPIGEPAAVSEVPSNISATSGRIELPTEATGEAGNLNIETRELVIQDGATIAVNGFSSGAAGELKVIADSITLDNEGTINASTVSGEGGNITLQVNNTISLQNNSTISAQAAGDANGGNININGQFIVAFPSNGDGNDIIASAERGEGGNINITAEALLGIEERPAEPGNRTNDIDASSQFGLSGSVTFNVPDTNNFEETSELSSNVISAEAVAGNACSPSAGVSSLVIQGKGGVPPEPNLPLSAEVLLGDVQPITPNFSQLNNQQTNQNTVFQVQPVKTSVGDIYPARGIIKTEDGRVILTAYPTGNNATRTPSGATHCN